MSLFIFTLTLPQANIIIIVWAKRLPTGNVFNLQLQARCIKYTMVTSKCENVVTLVVIVVVFYIVSFIHEAILYYQCIITVYQS